MPPAQETARAATTLQRQANLPRYCTLSVNGLSQRDAADDRLHPWLRYGTMLRTILGHSAPGPQSTGPCPLAPDQDHEGARFDGIA
jgi:hypothetical protein